MRSKRATITDVARQAGVSKATVSAVLNDTGSVKSTTRDRVVAAMELLNYRPAGLAGPHRARRGRSIGLLVKELDNPYYAEVALGARDHAEANGYTLVVASSEGSFDAERRAIEALQSMGVDGLLATPVLDDHSDLSHFYELKRRNFPFVLLEDVRGVRASLVDVDNVDAARRAVVHLIEQGHTRIAHLAGPDYSMHSHERVDGVRRAYSASHLIFTDDDVVAAGAHLEDGYRAGLALFRDRPAERRPTAVTCYNDLVAVGVYRALGELGLRVPDDVSVVGFDDLPLAEYLHVPLTTVQMPKQRMGAIAAEMLIGHVEANEVVPSRKVLLEAALVVRASTCPPAAGRPAAAATAIAPETAPEASAPRAGRAGGRAAARPGSRSGPARSAP
jgi:DNA-binding LacI/PurR family transcriptional regulator